MQKQEVILVSPQDEPLGVMEKMEAHRRGLLHRAFSVFIFDKGGRMLLQRRAPQKYHGGYLWTNACCSHPYWDEPVEEAAGRRLQEEMGFATELQKIFAFTYEAPVENNLIEHEYDHVFAGEYEGEIRPDSNEVCEYAYYDMADIQTLLAEKPGMFTTWFRIALPQIEAWWKKNYAVKERA